MITNNKTVKYLTRKKEVQESIYWYSDAINKIEAQQEVRRQTLKDLQQELFNLEKEYYNNGI